VITATLDMSDVVRGFEAVGRAARDLRPAWKDIRPFVRQDLREHFASAESPMGTWPKWAASTMERFRGARRSVGPGPYSHEHRDRVHARHKNTRADGRLNAGGIRRLQNMLGRLKSAWRFLSSRMELAAESLVSWADVHQVGGVAGHGSEIPARAFAWASSLLTFKVAGRIAQHMQEAWAR
jgi:phage gpG-like protein